MEANKASKTTNSDTANLHRNHRARMREKVLKNGVESFNDHELLEMLLFACDSRRNTNDTAHLLLERFGSLYGVLTASPDALKGIPHVKDAATAHIFVIREILRRIENENAERPGTFNSFDEIGKFFVQKFKMASVEEVHVAMFDNGMRMIGCVRVCTGTVNSAPECIRPIVNEALDKEASFVIIAHNHPGGKLIASPEDAIMTRTISSVFNALGITLVDHILVAENKYTSIMHTQY